MEIPRVKSGESRCQTADARWVIAVGNLEAARVRARKGGVKERAEKQAKAWCTGFREKAPTKRLRSEKCLSSAAHPGARCTLRFVNAL